MTDRDRHATFSCVGGIQIVKGASSEPNCRREEREEMQRNNFTRHQFFGVRWYRSHRNRFPVVTQIDRRDHHLKSGVYSRDHHIWHRPVVVGRHRQQQHTGNKQVYNSAIVSRFSRIASERFHQTYHHRAMKTCDTRHSGQGQIPTCTRHRVPQFDRVSNQTNKQ